jgi:Fe-S cluster assembly ATP-binding protein
MLSLVDFSVSVGEKHILAPLSFDFVSGRIYAFLGENGSGKSSFAFGLFGHPKYQTEGKISYHDEDISHASPDILSEKWLYLSFQNVPEIPGIRLIEYLRTIYTRYFERTHPGEKVPSGFVFRRMVEKLLPEYGIESAFLDRDLYVGFSGGEKRRIEMLQIALLDPACIVLDEIDAGLDIWALEILSKKIENWRKSGKICIIISHNFHLLDTIDVDTVIVMKDWQIDRHGWQELIQEVRERGF